MDGRGSNRFPTKQEDQEPAGVTSDNSGEFPFSGAIHEGKMTCSASSPKRSGRSVQKKVVSIPISDVHGSRLKGGDGAPPSDSWAWRKYGQKPIKGSPYPRGYYRCSSSKGCPARKQVERSRADPTMLVVTYACEHNHPGPASRNLPTKTTTTSTPTLTTTSPKEEEPATTVFTTEDKFRDLGGGNDVLICSDDFTWFSDLASSTSDVTLLESPVYGRGGTSSSGLDADVAMIFGEEDESLFADLGELPECSVVFRRGCIEQQQQEERRRCTLRA